VPKSIWF